MFSNKEHIPQTGQVKDSFCNSTLNTFICLAIGEILT
jgi:hypothetical protein